MAYEQIREHIVNAFSKTRSFLLLHRWLLLFIVVLVINGVLVYRHFIAPAPLPTPPQPEAPVAVPTDLPPPDGYVASLITGRYLPEPEARRRPVAVMVDNFSGARPQSGLNAAELVWELPVEGGVTRLLAVFQTEHETAIGPVRSAREYFLPLVEEVDAVYAHSGGSPAALQALRDSTLDDADEFRFGYAFTRSTERAAPHNLFTTTTRLDDLLDDRGWQQAPQLAAWPGSTVLPNGVSATTILVDQTRFPYRTSWRFDEEAKQYVRSVNGEETRDDDADESIASENVIVLFTEVTPAPRPGVPDAVSVSVTGDGPALFFRDGVALSGRWEKTADGERTKLFTKDDAPYELQRGRAWIHYVSTTRQDDVTYVE